MWFAVKFCIISKFLQFCLLQLWFLLLVTCWCLIIVPTVNHIRGKSTLVLMHSGIVNGYQLLCDAHTVSEQHRGTSALFLFYTIVLFRFFCICHSDSPISFLGTCIVWVNSLARTADLVLWFPDKTFDCTHPWFQNDLIVFMVPLNTY